MDLHNEFYDLATIFLDSKKLGPEYVIGVSQITSDNMGGVWNHIGFMFGGDTWPNGETAASCAKWLFNLAFQLVYQAHKNPSSIIKELIESALAQAKAEFRK